MRHRGELSDQEWERLEPLLPPERPERGRPNVDHRRIINGILWRERTGAPWRDLPERYGPWSTVYSRFWRWREAGIWDRVFADVQQQADASAINSEAAQRNRRGTFGDLCTVSPFGDAPLSVMKGAGAEVNLRPASAAM